MATKKSASKTTTGLATGVGKTPAKKATAKKVAAKKTTVKAAATESTQTPTTTAKAQPTQHDISVRAYLLWEQDGKKHGHHDQYWHKAERELQD